MSKSYSIAVARNHFTSIVRDVEQESVIELTRRGKPVALLVSVEEYERLRSNKKNFWNAYLAFREEFDLKRLAIEPDVFPGTRDTSPGREMNW